VVQRLVGKAFLSLAALKVQVFDHESRFRAPFDQRINDRADLGLHEAGKLLLQSGQTLRVPLEFLSLSVGSQVPYLAVAAVELRFDVSPKQLPV
jgi:hypothetical protein